MTTKSQQMELKLTKRQQMKLEKYASEVRTLIKSTLKSAVRIGQILKDVKENILSYGEWQKWVDYEFEGNIKHDSADNWINLAGLYEEYNELYGDGFDKLTLGVLYKLSRPTVDSSIKETVLSLASSDEPMKVEEFDTVLRSYRKVKMAEAGFEADDIIALSDSSVAEDSKELNAIKRLSTKKRDEVIKLLQMGAADSTKEALKTLKESKKAEVAEESKLVEVEYTQIIYNKYKAITELHDESVNVAIVEAPMRFDFVIGELNNLCLELDRVLAPGGVFIMTTGHKAILFAGDRIEPLKPLHVLCLRRQPGHTRSIIGTNIMSASVMCLYGYKPPYRAPHDMLVDLQTYPKAPDPNREYEEGFDEVVSGIEESFTNFLKPLVQDGDTILHLLESKQHFNIQDHLYNLAIELKAKEFISV